MSLKQRAERIGQATRILKEEYDKVKEALKAWKEAHAEWYRENRENIEFNKARNPFRDPYREIPREPRRPTKHDAEISAEIEILDKIQVSRRTMKEYVKVAKHRLAKDVQ